MVEVIATDEFVDWYSGLTEPDAEAVTRSVDLLQAVGTALPYPHSSAVRGSRYALRELRVQSGGRPLRVLYVFDPQRQAVLLIGGDKTGDNLFYERMVPQADRIYEQYLHEQGGLAPNKGNSANDS
jgi:hypothetical protein